MSAVFPLGTAFLPGDRVVLRVFEERYLRMVADLENTGEREFVSVLIERGSEVGGGDRRFANGVGITVEDIHHSDGVCVIVGTATRAVRIVRWLDDAPYPRAETAPGGWEPMSLASLRDAASAVTLLAQAARVLLARHGFEESGSPHPLADRLSTVASGGWFGTDPLQAEVERAFWTVARCVPCGPLDRHGFLLEPDGRTAVRKLKSVIEHTDEVLSFGMRDER